MHFLCDCLHTFGDWGRFLNFAGDAKLKIWYKRSVYTLTSTYTTAGDPEHDNVCCLGQAIQVINLLRLALTRTRPLCSGTYVATSEPTFLTSRHGSAFFGVPLGWKHRPGHCEACKQYRSHLLLLMHTNQNRRSVLLKDLQADLRDG